MNDEENKGDLGFIMSESEAKDKGLVEVNDESEFPPLGDRAVEVPWYQRSFERLATNVREVWESRFTMTLLVVIIGCVMVGKDLFAFQSYITLIAHLVVVVLSGRCVVLIYTNKDDVIYKRFTKQ